jgi:hypothetical protein
VDGIDAITTLNRLAALSYWIRGSVRLPSAPNKLLRLCAHTAPPDLVKTWRLRLTVSATCVALTAEET